MDFRPLPEGGAPAAEQIADALASGFPDPDRAAARAALLGHVLPWRLRGLASDSHPRRLAEVVYEDLVERLRGIPHRDRLAALEIVRCEIQGEELLAAANGLAVARYLLEHPGRGPSAPWLEVAGPYRTFDRGAIQAEAALRLRAAEELLASSAGECREALRLDVVLAQLTLGSARTGSFATAAGPFADFLRAMGEQPQVMDVH